MRSLNKAGGLYKYHYLIEILSCNFTKCYQWSILGKLYKKFLTTAYICFPLAQNVYLTKKRHVKMSSSYPAISPLCSPILSLSCIQHLKIRLKERKRGKEWLLNVSRWAIQCFHILPSWVISFSLEEVIWTHLLHPQTSFSYWI